MNKYEKSANAINSRENLCIEMCALFSRSTHACRITNDTHYRHRPRLLFSSLAQSSATGRMRYFQSKCNKLSMHVEQLKINN